MSEYQGIAYPKKYIEDRNISADLHRIFRRLGIIPADPMADLMEVLKSGMNKAEDNFGKPDHMLVAPGAIDLLKKAIEDNDDLK